MLYKEFVIVTVAQQCNRMTATGQGTDNKIFYKKAMYKIVKTQYNIDNYVCTGLICANLKLYLNS